MTSPAAHPTISRQLTAAITSANSYAFCGGTSAARLAAADYLARAVNCESARFRTAQSPAAPCGRCPSCRQVAAGAHPDIIHVAPDEKGTVGVEQIRLLASKLAAKPYYADSQRIVIFDDAAAMTAQAQNALLKTLEDSAAGTRIILSVDNAGSLLSTVVSRVATINFLPAGESATDASSAPASAAPAPAIIRSLSLFDRLKLAKTLADDGVDLKNIAREIHKAIISDLRNGIINPDAAANDLAATAKVFEGAEHNLNRKVILERLMLELSGA